MPPYPELHLQAAFICPVGAVVLPTCAVAVACTIYRSSTAVLHVHGSLKQTVENSLWNLQEKGFSAHGSYALSKIAMMAFTAKLAKRLQKHGGPTVNCLDPGTVNTKMLYAGWGQIGMPVSVSPLAPRFNPLSPFSGFWGAGSLPPIAGCILQAAGCQQHVESSSSGMALSACCKANLKSMRGWAPYQTLGCMTGVTSGQP